MQKEIDSLSKNQTWDLVPRPQGENIVKCRWVYRTKFTSKGVVELHKALVCLIIRCIGATFAFLKRPVVDASLACLPSVRCLVRGFQIFLNGGKNCFFGLRGNHASPTRKCPGNLFIT
jgi:hypothetical protein